MKTKNSLFCRLMLSTFILYLSKGKGNHTGTDIHSESEQYTANHSTIGGCCHGDRRRKGYSRDSSGITIPFPLVSLPSYRPPSIRSFVPPFLSCFVPSCFPSFQLSVLLSFLPSSVPSLLPAFLLALLASLLGCFLSFFLPFIVCYVAYIS